MDNVSTEEYVELGKNIPLCEIESILSEIESSPKRNRYSKQYIDALQILKTKWLTLPNVREKTAP